MVYFIILFLLLFFIYYFDYAKHKRFDKLAYWGMFVFMVIVVGLRYRIGNDTIGYERAYEKIPTLAQLYNFKFESLRFEPGYVVLCSITRTFSRDFFWFQLLHAVLLNSAIFIFIKNNTRNKYFCLTLYLFTTFFFFNTEVLRESLAVACFLMAWPAFRDNKWIIYYLWVALAITFHSSAWLLAIIPLAYIPGIRSFFKFGKRSIFLGIIVFAIAFVVQMKFYGYIKALSLTDTLTDRAEAYSKDRTYGGSNLNIFGMLDIFIRYIFYAVLAIYIFRHQKKKGVKIYDNPKVANKLEFLIMWQYYFALVALSIFILLRFVDYFIMFTNIMLASIYLGKVDIGKKVYRIRPLYWAVFYLPFFFMFIKTYYAPLNNAGLRYYVKYFPYASVLDPVTDSKREAAFRLYDVR